MECPEGLTYYPYSRKCNDYYSYCYKFYCNGYSGLKRTHPLSSSLYTYCIDNEATLVDECPVENFLNETSQRCEPYCYYEGFRPDTNDCTKYYRCNKETFGYKRTHLKCPEGTAYSTYEFRCLPLSQVPTCNPSSVGFLSMKK